MHVPFDVLLDLTPFACARGEPATQYAELVQRGHCSDGAAPLQLYGVVEHIGTFEGGHYVAFVRLGSQWYRMNDSVVKQVEEAEVLRAQAFLLFYERRDEAASSLS